MKHIKNLRTDYNKNELNIKDLSANPIDFFEEWMKDAVNQLVEPNAFVLSTVVFLPIIIVKRLMK